MACIIYFFIPYQIDIAILMGNITQLKGYQLFIFYHVFNSYSRYKRCTQAFCRQLLDDLSVIYRGAYIIPGIGLSGTCRRCRFFPEQHDPRAPQRMAGDRSLFLVRERLSPARQQQAGLCMHGTHDGRTTDQRAVQQ